MKQNEMDYKQFIALAKNSKKLCIVCALAIMTVVTAVSYMLPNKYEAKSTVFVEQSVIADLVKGLAATTSVEDKIKALTYALNSRTLITKVIGELDLKKGGDAEQEELIKNLQDHTQIKIKDKEDLFIITFQDRSPKLARDYVNALVRRYIDENTSSKREDSYGATRFLSEQLVTFREKLQKSEEAANAFKRGPGAIAAMDPTSLLKDINDSQQRADDLNIKQAQLETVIANLPKENSTQSDLPALKKRLQELQLQYTDKYPDIVRLKADIRALEDQQKTAQGKNHPVDTLEYKRAVSELKAMRQAETNLRANIAKNRALLQNIPAAKSTLEDLEREKNSQKILYETMAARQGQSEVSKQMELQDKSTVFRVVDPAVLPIKPVGPNRVKLIFLGILAGICGGIGLVLLKDRVDDSVKNIEMAGHFGLSILAVIPRIVDQKQIEVQARQDRKLYIASGLYFSVILAILVLEVLGFTAISNLIGRFSGFIS
jgi:polysaccharide chain length determinant protein (PEP-CTERM system associated)